MAKDYFNFYSNQLKYQVVGGIISPVSDSYGKKSLISASDRVEMCRLACEDDPFVVVESWESFKNEWTPTLNVLKHFNEEIKFGNENIKIMLLIGSDLIEGFKNFKVWNQEELKELIKEFGLVIIERTHNSFSSIQSEIFQSDLLYASRENIFVIPQTVSTDLSSSKLRLLIKRGNSIKYLTNDKVIEYIRKRRLYTEHCK